MESIKGLLVTNSLVEEEPTYYSNKKVLRESIKIINQHLDSIPIPLIGIIILIKISM